MCLHNSILPVKNQQGKNPFSLYTLQKKKKDLDRIFHYPINVNKSHISKFTSVKTLKLLRFLWLGLLTSIYYFILLSKF
jgi:hypothetical protein